MIDFLIKTPFYVWIVLVLLLWSGIKSLGLKNRKTYTFHMYQILIMPIAMFLWSALNVFRSYCAMIEGLWLAMLAIGSFLGYKTVKSDLLTFDKSTNMIQAKASALPLILSLSIFALRYFIGANIAINESAKELLSIQVSELGACFICAVMLGRCIGYIYYFKKRSPLQNV